MVCVEFFSRQRRRSILRALPPTTILLALLLGGCSADVARFDFPTFSLTDKSGSAPPMPPEPMRNGGATLMDRNATDGYGSGGSWGSSGYAPPPSSGGRGSQVQMSALPEPPRAEPVPAYQPSPRRVAPVPEQRTSLPARADPGDVIEVQPGDTLYEISQRYQVSIAELMSANGLSTPALKPGQRLYLPPGRSGRHMPPAKERTVAALEPPATRPEPSRVPDRHPASAARFDGTYTMKSGDSLYGVARRHGITVAELQQANGITDVRKVRPGTVLKVPALREEPSGKGAPVPPAVVEAPPAAATPAAAAPATVTAKTQPIIINTPDKRVAALNDKTSDATEPESPAAAPRAPTAPPKSEQAAMTRLRWPVAGKVIGGFGPRPDGTHNDGVNIAVPMGTEVHAAEAGVVAYAGNELKAYGNLVLIRHDNGWVTAYAHNDQLIAKRGDRVKRGQVIAKAGKSGQVDQPQVHFELRQGSSPVDPVPFLEKL